MKTKTDLLWWLAVAALVIVAVLVITWPLHLPDPAPEPAPPQPPPPARVETPAPPNDEPAGLIYIVQRGDTVANIARLFSVRTENLRDINNSAPVDQLIPGQNIIILPPR